MSDSNLKFNELTMFRLDEINKVKEYFNSEINERKEVIKKLSKYIVVFDYADKIFITLSASFGTLSLVSYATVVGIPVGIAGGSLTVLFTVTTGIVKKLLNATRKKKKEHNKVIALARNKLNIIETLMSQALIDFEISHDEFSKIIDEKIKNEGIKENVSNIKNINDAVAENNQITSFFKNKNIFFLFIKWLLLPLKNMIMQKLTR